MTFPSIRIEGAILSGDLLAKLDGGECPGQRPADFGFDSAGKLKDEIVRAWTAGQAFYTAFQHKLEGVKEGAAATSETRNQWIIPLLGLFGYSDLEFQSQSELVGDKPFRLSHHLRSHGGFRVHIVGARESLDKKPAASSGVRYSPHAHLQEYLNLTEHLYAVVTNGRLVRLLRDSTRLVRLSYVEFDLDRMFGEDLFADFAVFYRLLHVSRLPKTPGQSPESLLEHYHQDSLASGERIRDGLSGAVEQVIQELGSGFLARNESLQAAIANNSVSTRDLHCALLRLIYRLLLMMVAEERGLLFAEAATPRQRKLYLDHYSIARLRRLAERRAFVDPAKHDLWRGLRSTFRLFETDGPGAPLGLTGLGGQLFSAAALGPLQDAELDNGTLLSALAKLSLFRQPDTRQLSRVNYGALATEEFGSVYERLLELHPVIHPAAGNLAPTFAFKQAAGNERKTTGSYYTPSSLVECLLDSALDPVLDDRLKNFAKHGYKSADEAVLALKVCDPACGSGHFLIAAAQRIARRLALLRSKGDEPSVSELRHTLREVISHCIYGVDINPMSVELCKVALWLEAMEAGKPLSFLDHHIRCGNSLLGATPALIAEGIPDDAFTAIEGDDKKACSALKKLNARERTGFGELFALEDRATFERLQQAAVAVENLPDDSVRAVEQKSAAFEQLQHNYDLQKANDLANLWCAAFVIRKRLADGELPLAPAAPSAAAEAQPAAKQTGLFGETFQESATKSKTPAKATGQLSGLAEAIGITSGHLRDFAKGLALPDGLMKQAQELAKQYHFFHWYLAFPEVFKRDGFDVVLGNPPWEMMELGEKEFFAQSAPEIANASSARVRQTLIEELRLKSPLLFKEFSEAKKLTSGFRHFVQDSGRFPLSSTGRINLYPLFVECSVNVQNNIGRAGIIVPSAISMDAYNAPLFASLVESSRLASLLDFENRDAIFSGVHRSYRFCLLTVAGRDSAVKQIELCYFAHSIAEISDLNRRISMTSEEVALFSPNTLSPPMLLNATDKQLAQTAYRRFGVLVHRHSKLESAWSASIQRMLSLSDPGDIFRRADELKEEAHDTNSWARLYCGKAIHQYDHRYATWASSGWEYIDMFGHQLPDKAIHTEYYARTAEVLERLANKKPNRWLLSYRDVCRATDERTVIAAIIPATACDTTCRNIYVSATESETACFLSNLNSFAFDYFARQKVIGIHLGAGVFEQLPTVTPARFSDSSIWSRKSESCKDWLFPRVLELTYTAWDLEAFAQDCGWSGPPFRWNEERRFQLRCELDAAFFHLYGLNRDDTAYILDTFPIVKRKDVEKFGTYRTKDRILELYDALAEAQRTGKVFESSLNPPPADALCCHPPKQAATASDEPIEVSRLTGRPIEQTPSTPVRHAGITIPTARERIGSPDLEAAVGRFDFTFPSKLRPHVATTGELFTLLLPALVQEAGGQLDYEEFLEAMSFLANPPKSLATLPQAAASQFGKWRTNYPSNLIDASALKAALHDHIVMRKTLGILSDGSNFVLFKGVQWVDMTLDWLVFDARLALAHAAKTQTVESSWTRAVAERDLKAWTTA